MKRRKSKSLSATFHRKKIINQNTKLATKKKDKSAKYLNKIRHKKNIISLKATILIVSLKSCSWIARKISRGENQRVYKK